MAASTPGTYGFIMPPTGEGAGQTQVFDEWNVEDALVEGYYKAGEMGISRTNNDAYAAPSSYSFAQGRECRVWTDAKDNLPGFGADISARYATVSPDVSAPLFEFDRLVECKTVERGDPLTATFACEEPGGLGSGVASCVLTDRVGIVTSGESLNTSVPGTQSFVITATTAGVRLGVVTAG